MISRRAFTIFVTFTGYVEGAIACSMRRADAAGTADASRLMFIESPHRRKLPAERSAADFENFIRL